MRFNPVNMLLFGALASGCTQSLEVPDFSLTDVNPGSSTFEQSLGPADFEGQVSAWYFGWATCPLCQAHVDELDRMMVALDDDRIVVLGINEVGKESGNESMTDGHVMPWLQDTAEIDVFGTWSHKTLRELKVLGPDGVEVETFDLNVQDPRETKHFDAIQQALLDALPQR